MKLPPARTHHSLLGLVALMLVATTCVGPVPGAPASPTPQLIIAKPTLAPVYPLAISDNDRYLVDQNDQPFFMFGEAGWSLIAEATTADVDIYFASRQQLGFNAVLVNLIEAKFATNAPNNIYNVAPFTGTTFITPNEAYFAHADYVISAAAAHGMVVLLVPLYLGYMCSDEGWCEEVQDASTADLQAWAEFVGERYEAYDNILWVIGADVDPSAYSGVAAKVDAFATALAAADTRHLMTAHNAPGQMATDPWPGAAWLAVNNTYAAQASAASLAEDAYTHSPTAPFFHMEGYYENEHSMTAQLLRAQSYWSVLGGAFGYLFGNCPIWGLGSAASAYFCPGTDSDWTLQLESTGSRHTALVASLFNSLAWQDLVPDWNHTTLTAGYGTLGNSNYAAAARAADGSLVLAYLPSSRTVTVDMERLAASATARWYDPSNGAYTTIPGSPFQNTGTRQFTPTGNNSSGAGDWVLVLETEPPASPQPSIFLPSILRGAPLAAVAQAEHPYWECHSVFRGHR